MIFQDVPFETNSIHWPKNGAPPLRSALLSVCCCVGDAGVSVMILLSVHPGKSVPVTPGRITV